MGNRRSHITDYLLKAIPWTWVAVEPLIDEAIHMVPPGEAHRKYVDRYSQDQIRKGRVVVESSMLPTESQRIRSGARTIVSDRLKSLNEVGEIERRNVDGVRQVRRTERRSRPIGLTVEEAWTVAYGAPPNEEERLLHYLNAELARLVEDAVEVQ